MSLRHAVFAGRIARRAFNRPDLTFTTHTALELVLNFGTRASLERIGAAEGAQPPREQQQDLS